MNSEPLFPRTWMPSGQSLGRLLLFLAFTTFLALGLPAKSVGGEVPSLRQLLSPEDFHTAGLEKLTPEELTFLSERLVRSGVAATQRPKQPPEPHGDASLPRGEDAFGSELRIESEVAKATAVPAEIRSRLDGRFAGWSGRTVFRLANGQVWQQTAPGEFAVNLEAPEVTIRRSTFGAYLLSVAGYGPQVKVKRIK